MFPQRHSLQSGRYAMTAIAGLLSALVALPCAAQIQTFANTTAAACGTWDSGNAYAGFQRTVLVGGLPATLSAAGTASLTTTLGVTFNNPDANSAPGTLGMSRDDGLKLNWVVVASVSYAGQQQ